MRIHAFWNTNLTKNMFTEKNKNKSKNKKPQSRGAEKAVLKKFQINLLCNKSSNKCLHTISFKSGPFL